MKEKTCISFLMLFLAIALTKGYAQTEESFPYYIEWEPVSGAGGYVVEIQSPDGTSTLREQLDSSAHDIELKLPPGFYRFRLVTLNNFLRFENATEWLDFEVQTYSSPAFISLSPLTIYTENRILLTLKANLLASSGSASLVSPSGNTVPLEIRKTSAGTFELTAPPQSERGTWSLVLINPPDHVTRKHAILALNYPDPEIASVLAKGTVLSVTGDNFSPEAVLSVLSGERSVKLLNQTHTATHLAGEFPKDLEPGTYTVYLTNAPDLVPREAGNFQIAPAEVAKVQLPKPVKPPKSGIPNALPEYYSRRFYFM